MQRSYKNQHLNFRKNEKVQVREDGVWRDYTKACSSKLVIEFALRAERLYGIGNVKIVTI
jgi:hypothetical protein